MGIRRPWRVAWPAALIIALLMVPAPVRSARIPVCETCDTAQTIERRVPPPDGFERTPANPGTYAHALRNLTLLPPNTSSNDWRGQVAMTAGEVAAVIDWRLLGSVEQCADVALRMHAEYLLAENRESEVVFRSLSGQRISWPKWLAGRFVLNHEQTRIRYQPERPRQQTREEFDRYLRFVMTYTNTASMLRDWPRVADSMLASGDVLIQPFNTIQQSGHLSIIVDACVDDDGNKRFLFADGYTPARIPVIRQRIPGQPGTAWMTPTEYLNTMRHFGAGSFHRFPGSIE